MLRLTLIVLMLRAVRYSDCDRLTPVIENACAAGEVLAASFKTPRQALDCLLAGVNQLRCRWMWRSR